MEAFIKIRGSVVVKPLDGCQGKGVSLQLRSPSDIRNAVRIAMQFSNRILIEEYVDGNHYRVLLVAGRVIAVAERIPAHVIGNGIHTVQELIDLTNKDPNRGFGHEKPLTRIVIDEALLAYLSRTGKHLGDVPSNNEKVFLRDNANLSTGGQAIDVTDQIHPNIAQLCERAAEAIGLDICGLDLVAEDISLEPVAGNCQIIEVNAAPGIRMHHFPSGGQSRDVGEAILQTLYPLGSTARIPIFSITGTNGKTTTTRMIGHILEQTGRIVGMTTTEGVFIGGQEVMHGDTTGPRSAQMVLSDPNVEVAVLETARGGIVRSGLGYDWSDVAIITNIQQDHIGQDNIEHLNDLIHIKSLIAERVREGGILVLNADDENLVKLIQHPRLRETRKQVIFFSMYSDHPYVKRHVAIGGTAYFVRDGWIVEVNGRHQKVMMHVSEIPVTLGGVAEFHIENAMAAMAACRAYGLTREKIVQSLSTFSSTLHNPGRANLYQVDNGYVMVDYGHNPDSFEAICRMAGRIKGRKITGVIGVPGDRDNAIVHQSARVAARGFDKLIVKEDQDTRGRRRGEIADLMCETITQTNSECAVQVVLHECEALECAIREMEKDEMVVVFYEKLAPIQELLVRLCAKTVDSLVEADRPVASIVEM